MQLSTWRVLGGIASAIAILTAVLLRLYMENQTAVDDFPWDEDPTMLDYTQPTQRTTGIAPLYTTPTCPSDLIPNEYYVYMMPDYTLEQHQQFVGDNIDLKSVRVLDIARPYNLYHATLTAEQLALVRSDLGVTSIEGNFRMRDPDEPCV